MINVAAWCGASGVLSLQEVAWSLSGGRRGQLHHLCLERLGLTLLLEEAQQQELPCLLGACRLAPAARAAGHLPGPGPCADDLRDLKILSLCTEMSIMTLIPIWYACCED